MEDRWKKFLRTVVPWIAMVIMVGCFIMAVVAGIHIIVAVAGKMSFWIWLLWVVTTAWYAINAIWNLFIWLVVRKAQRD